MIFLIHNNKQAVEVLDERLQGIKVNFTSNQLTTQLFELASLYPKQIIAWCYLELKTSLNPDGFNKVFHHEKIMASFNPSNHNYLLDVIGYVDRSYFYKVNKSVTYPTWLMSSMVGGLHASVLNTVRQHIDISSDFNYFLISLAKQGMPQGLFCYSSPNLLLTHKEVTNNKAASTATLFKFVKEHYKWVWAFYLALAYLVYERKLMLFSLLKSLVYKQLKRDLSLDTVEVKSFKSTVQEKTVDVIIPTIGRKPYLYDVLKDLSNQTVLPKQVIIVEQNPDKEAFSELDYLTTQDWPFIIKHTFTHQTGVCNARNIALQQIKSAWVFFADDDIRFEKKILEHSFEILDTYGIKAINYLCLQPHQKQTFFKIHQTTIFGSGSSLVSSKELKGLQFNLAYENGFGEDTEFGMQLRNKGVDIVFVPELKITHLKAPIGGFRTKVLLPWQKDIIQPKPSPTIYLLQSTYFTIKQLQGYQLLLGLKEYRRGNEKNPFKFVKQFKAKWQKSAEWSQKLSQSINA
ncbi:MAG: glycosyltransferase family 2 protein [Mesoflavibacter sp.]|uniref:glycosyltransferase family 2 protein n=1 Tax=Mesoflavibacter sp. CH_XMU1404-2 TaxID=3107766 RepID=UPI00300BBBD4|nr:glycosyltransferase family 2 protein [Mesoflavibacter sp.]